MKIEVKGIKYFSSMSDETNCFQATLYVDGKKVATCENQGCGGNTNICSLPGQEDKLKEAEKYAKSLPAHKTQYGDISSDLELIVDCAVDDYVNDLEEKKYQKYIEKTCLNHLVTSEGRTWSILNKMSFEDVLKKYPAQYQQLIQKFVDDVKTKLRPNEVIINKNLEKYGVKI